MLFVFFSILPIYATAQEQELKCSAKDQKCLLLLLENETDQIEENRWRDQTYRELAKLLTTNGQNIRAMSLISKIENNDTKAMTIRGIGMAAADLNLGQEEYETLFKALRAEAEKIDHPPSYAIALTYIAMSQAFAGDDEGAMTTAMSMKNASLRYKALGETAEIQAEYGNLVEAQKSLNAISDIAFRNKAHLSVSKIFAKIKKFDEALAIANNIENNYQKAQAILYILERQNSYELQGKN
jgi:hypothetical protein